MKFVRVARHIARSLAGVAIVVLLLTPTAQAQKVDVSGRYQCVEVKVKGKAVACTAAPLILKNDGRFELRGWEGSYLVSGGWVELSDAMVKARVKIAPGHRVVLRYYGKAGLVEMTYERRVAELGTTALG